MLFLPEKIRPLYYVAPLLFSKQLRVPYRVKSLRVILDSFWPHTHIEDKIKTTTSTLWACRRAVGRTWCLTLHVMLWLYTYVVKPMITYNLPGNYRNFLNHADCRHETSCGNLVTLPCCGRGLCDEFPTALQYKLVENINQKELSVNFID